MMAYPAKGEDSNLSECGQDNVHGSGAHADLPTETADRWVGILGYYFCGTLYMYYFCVCVCFFLHWVQAYYSIAIFYTEYANIAILYSAPLTDPKQLSTREFLNCSAQEIIDDLNSKRKRDAALLEGNSSSCARDLE